MQKWLKIIGLVFLIEVLAEAVHLTSDYILLRDLARTDIIAFVALFLSVSILIHKEI